MADLNVDIVAVERNIWSGPATFVFTRTTSGEIGILPRHTPLVAQLVDDAMVRVEREGEDDLRIAIDGGFLSVHKWPEYDDEKTVDDEVEIVVQVNGKIKDKLMISAGLDKDGTLEAAMASEKIKNLIDGKTIVKTIAVPGKLVNIVVKG